jgi:hypothetical protein
MYRFKLINGFSCLLGLVALLVGGAEASVINTGSISASFRSIVVAPTSSESSFVKWDLTCETNSTFYPTPSSTGITDPHSNTTSDGTAVSNSSSGGGGDLQSTCDSAQGGQVDLTGSLSLFADGEGGETGGRAISTKTIALIEDATVTVTLDYTYDLVLTTSKDGETAEGFTSLILGLGVDSLLFDSAGTPLTVVRNGADLRDEGISGTLSVSGDFSAASEIIIGIDAALHLRGTIEESDDDDDDKVPEPGSLFLFGVGVMGLAGIRRRRLRC